MNKLLTLTALSLLLVACGREQVPATQPAAQPDAAAGRALAESQCMNCHGLDGRSAGADIPHLAGQRLEYLQLALREYRSGARPHAALQQLFSQLDEGQLANVAAYYASLPRISPAAPVTPADLVKARDAAKSVCASCHGEDGNALKGGVPTLAGQHRDYLLAAMQAYKEGRRKHPVMDAQFDRIDTLGLQHLAAYYAAQTARPQARKPSGDVALGERLSANCGSCHGLKGHTLNAETPALAGQDPQYLLAALKAYRDGGRVHREMREMLSAVKEADLPHLAAFYAVQTPAAEATRASLTATEWAERCDRCHGPAAAPANLVVPHIEGQPRAYLARVLRAYRDGHRHQSVMHAMGMPLTDADIEAIADYYAALPPR